MSTNSVVLKSRERKYFISTTEDILKRLSKIWIRRVRVNHIPVCLKMKVSSIYHRKYLVLAMGHVYGNQEP